MDSSGDVSNFRNNKTMISVTINIVECVHLERFLQISPFSKDNI